MTAGVIAGEQRSVDDQVEWFDDQHLVYAVADDTPGSGGTSIWKVNIEGGRHPRGRTARTPRPSCPRWTRGRGARGSDWRLMTSD